MPDALFPPVRPSEMFARLRVILANGWQTMPTLDRYKGTGAPGNFLEDQLGLRVGAQDIADCLGWEVKYYTEKTALITLFHKEPEPPGIVVRLVNRYGWKDRLGRKSFRHTINGKSDRFEAVNDAGNIIVRSLNPNGAVPIWTHDTLLNICGGKLRRLVLVKGERDGREVRFLSACCYQDLLMTRLMDEIVRGTIAIDFDAREMKPGSRGLRNHGTKFRVRPENIGRLYSKKKAFS